MPKNSKKEGNGFCETFKICSLLKAYVEKINILYIIDQFTASGGTETHLANLLFHLNKERFNPFLLVFDLKENPLVQKIREAHIPIFHIPVGRYYTFNALKKAFSLSHIIKRKQIDIVQSYHFKSDFYGVLVSKLSGVKSIISSKRDTGDLKKKIQFFLHRFSNNYINHYIFVADAVRGIVMQREHINSSNFTVIYNGVDSKRFHPANRKAFFDTREKFGFSKSDFIVGTVAWLRPEKSYGIFFEAIEQLNEKISELKVVVVGGGDLLEYFKEDTRKRGIKDKVFFVGSTDDVRPYLRMMDVACLVPGQNEGFSNSIIEKMAMGLPLIVTDVGGNREAVFDGHNGLVIPPRDVSALSHAILDLYLNPDKRRAMGHQSRQRVKEYFTIDKIVKQHENLYESLL